jgi:hypothetical protein
MHQPRRDIAPVGIIDGSQGVVPLIELVKLPLGCAWMQMCQALPG